MTKDQRRALLMAYLSQELKGDRAELIRRARLSKGRISQLLTEGMGERSARDLEERLKLPAGYFESASASHVARQSTGETKPEDVAMDLQREAAELVRAWLSLNEIDRNRFKRQLEVAALQNRELAPEPKVDRFGDAPRGRPMKSKAGTQ